VVTEALEAGASDVIVSEGRSPRLRFAGDLETLEGPVTTRDEIEIFIASHLTPVTRARFYDTGSADLAYTPGRAGESRRLRANLFRHQGGLCLALRAIRERIP